MLALAACTTRTVHSSHCRGLPTVQACMTILSCALHACLPAPPARIDLLCQPDLLCQAN